MSFVYVDADCGQVAIATAYISFFHAHDTAHTKVFFADRHVIVDMPIDTFFNMLFRAGAPVIVTSEAEELLRDAALVDREIKTLPT